MNYKGKIKENGSPRRPRPDWKKAVIKIDLDPKPETYLTKGGKEVAKQGSIKQALKSTV
jgi:large subunit ribosomal protein L23